MRREVPLCWSGAYWGIWVPDQRSSIVMLHRIRDDVILFCCYTSFRWRTVSKAQSSHGVKASTSEVSIVEPVQIRNPEGASR